jgi:hypothetical protein
LRIEEDIDIFASVWVKANGLPTEMRWRSGRDVPPLLGGRWVEAAMLLVVVVAVEVRQWLLVLERLIGRTLC